MGNTDFPSPHLADILKKLPTTAGVYQMKDVHGETIYVGKAKNLKRRVSSYFDRTKDLTLAKKQMVAKIKNIEIIVCETEVEALVLETNLIKHKSPKYNILMKDDKNLAYIKISHSPIPELIKTRQKIRDGSEYFGPYVAGAEQSIRVLRRIFKIRNCRMKFMKKPTGEVLITDKAGRSIPCMDFYIGLCPAPCTLREKSIREHDEHLDRARSFLLGKKQELFDLLQEEMQQKAKQLDFESAQEIKEALEVLKNMGDRQRVRDIVEGDIDVFLRYEKYDKYYLVLTQIRSSQIVGVLRHEVMLGASEFDDACVNFLMRQYVDTEDLPSLLLLKESLSDESLTAFLHEQKIIVEYPQIGPKASLLDFAFAQIREYAYKREMTALENRTLTRAHMANILEHLGYPVPERGPIVFECYDISHTHGYFTYASRVCITDGKPDSSRYKKYKIKTLQDGEIDDFASHREVMYRRALEGAETGNFPNLIIIDGGKGQLSRALLGIKEGLYEAKKRTSDERVGEVFPSICSIAKREEEIFLPNQKEPILFEAGTPELMIIQKARDESHRFSITANRSERTKSMKKNILEELPGIGPVTRKNLLRLAGSTEAIKNLSKEEMLGVLNKKQLETLLDHGFWGT